MRKMKAVSNSIRENYKAYDRKEELEPHTFYY